MTHAIKASSVAATFYASRMLFKVAAYGAAVFPAIFGAADDKGLVLYLFAVSAGAARCRGSAWINLSVPPLQWLPAP